MFSFVSNDSAQIKGKLKPQQASPGSRKLLGPLGRRCCSAGDAKHCLAVSYSHTGSDPFILKDGGDAWRGLARFSPSNQKKLGVQTCEDLKTQMSCFILSNTYNLLF